MLSLPSKRNGFEEYKSPGLTDAQALARYMKDMDDSNAVVEGIGIKDDRYYYNYDWGESSRLHNKIAISNQAISKIKKTYPDGKNQVNFKIVMSFYTEFSIARNERSKLFERRIDQMTLAFEIVMHLLIRFERCGEINEFLRHQDHVFPSFFQCLGDVMRLPQRGRDLALRISVLLFPWAFSLWSPALRTAWASVP